MKLASLVALLLGVALLTLLVAWQGIDTVAGTLALIGWQVLWLVPLFLPPLLLSSEAWLVLFPAGTRRPSRPAAALATWISLAVNTLLPAAQIGGSIVKARLAVQRGVPGDAAFATALVDKFFQAVSQVLYALLGLGLFLTLRSDPGVVAATLLFGALLTLGLIGFYRVQRAGLFGLLARLGGRVSGAAAGWAVPAAAVDALVRRIYASPRAVAGSLAWRVLQRLAMAAESWLLLHLLGHPASLTEAIVLESLGQAVRAAAFLVPGGLGAQEGGFMLLGAALGLGPETGLALSLAKRGRELLVGLPALVVWQIGEGGSLLGRRAARQGGAEW